MKRLFLIAKVVLVTLCITSVAWGANIKVVCKSDPKHDRAKLIQAMKTARSGDKIVIIGTCLPRGVQASARRAYRPNLIKVQIFETRRPQQYNSWKFDREIIYSPVYDTPLPRTVIIDNSRNVRSGVTRSTGVRKSTAVAPSRSSSGVKATSSRSTTKTTTSKTTEMKEGATSEDKEQAKDEQKTQDEATPEENAKTQEEAAPEENADAQEEAAPEENANTQEEAAPEESADTQEEAAPESDSQSELAESDGGSEGDSGSDGGDDGGSESSDDSE